MDPLSQIAPKQIKIDNLNTPANLAVYYRRWDEASNLNGPERQAQNEELLLNLINNPDVSDGDLYRFFYSRGIQPQDSWFIGRAEGSGLPSPTPLAQRFENQRRSSILDFFHTQAAHATQSEDLRQYALNWVQNSQHNNNIKTALKILHYLIDHPDRFPDSDLYQFFLTQQIRPNGGWFEPPGDDADRAGYDIGALLEYKRLKSVMEFYRQEALADLRERWNVATQPIHNVLHLLIKMHYILDDDVWHFLKERNITIADMRNATTPDGQSYDNLFLAHRGKTVTEFMNVYAILSFRSEWMTNNREHTEENRRKNLQVLYTLIDDPTITDTMMIHFFIDVGIRPNGGWFFFAGRDEPVKLHLLNVRPAMQSYFAPLERPALPLSRENPLQHAMTLTGHGIVAEHTFRLPTNIYLLVPHPQGFRAHFQLMPLYNNVSFEEKLYEDNHQGQIQIPTSGGWHLYSAGQDVPNISLYPWQGSDDIHVEWDNWKRQALQEDVEGIPLIDGHPPQYAKVHGCRKGTREPLNYEGSERYLVKIFGQTNLASVCRSLSEKNPEEPVLLILFISHSNSSQDKKITFHGRNMQSLNQVITNLLVPS